MIIVIEQTVKDSGGNFEAGNRHTVGVSINLDTAERLIAHGWAHAEGDQPGPSTVPGDVTLNVQSATIGQRADNIG